MIAHSGRFAGMYHSQASVLRGWSAYSVATSGAEAIRIHMSRQGRVDGHDYSQREGKSRQLLIVKESSIHFDRYNS